MFAKVGILWIKFFTIFQSHHCKLWKTTRSAAEASIWELPEVLLRNGISPRNLNSITKVIKGSTEGKECLAHLAVLKVRTCEFLYEPEVAWQIRHSTLGNGISHNRKHLISIQNKLIGGYLYPSPEFIDANRNQISCLLYLLHLLNGVLMRSEFP